VGSLSAESLFSQQTRIAVRFENKAIEAVLEELKAQTGYEFVYVKDVFPANRTVTMSMNDATLEQVLDAILSPNGLNYRINDQLVIITATQQAQQQNQQPQAQQQPATASVTGHVTDGEGKPIIGVAVTVRGTTRGTVTDVNGRYTLSWPARADAVLLYSYLGMTPQEVVYTGQQEINVTMRDAAQAIDDVVVTGYFDRTRQSFTGSEVSVRGEELRQLGAMNMLTAISVFDPSVRTIPNNDWGSDPNRVPEISIRGENGFDLRDAADDARTNPNSPLYVLDGVEVSPTVVFDLDMNRIEAFTILKDAAATALYGSRGANGVILIATIRPRAGELRVTANANYFVSIPDLRDYNLMNAREKLEFERRAGVYSNPGSEAQMQLDIDYNNLLGEIARGVNTYWLSQPLQTSVNQRYNAFVEGGDQHLRYGVDLRYDNDQGVMRGSGRERYGIRLNLNYNIRNKFRFFNDLIVDDVTGRDSPYGSFSQYTMLNPYERIYDPETGEMNRFYRVRADDGNGWGIMANPLFDGLLPNRSVNRYTEIRDNFTFEWRINNHLQVKGLASLTKRIGKYERYRSPESSDFFFVTRPEERGSYTVRNSNSMNFDGNLRVMYNNVFAEKFTLSAGAGSEIQTFRFNEEGFTATGFVNDKLTNPAFAAELKRGSQTGSFDRTRLAGFFANVNVGYENRFFIDGSFRTDGSSKFGRNQRFAPFWSVGAAWNVDREAWWKGDGYMKLRASVGEMGQVNFSSDQAITRFYYLPDSEYNGFHGAVLGEFGNPNLRWQTTLQYNVGVDMSIWQNIVVLNLDAYIKRTKNLLLAVDVAPSTGFSSYRENLGEIDNSGVEARLRFNIIRDRQRDLLWSVTLMGAHNRNEIRRLSTAMKAMNDEAYSTAIDPDTGMTNSSGARVFRLYQEGRSQSALAVVRSLGIDPMTGQEIYVNLDGTLTYEYDPRQKVIVGDINPRFQGNIQTNLTWKGFNLFAAFNYEHGAKIFNSTMAQKVEGARRGYNADRRALYDRWYQPGDRTLFRDVANRSPVYQSSRLVQRNDFLRLSNISLNYELPRRYLAASRVERLRITLASSDLFRIATVRAERGLNYPFARSFSLGCSVTF